MALLFEVELAAAGSVPPCTQAYLCCAQHITGPCIVSGSAPLQAREGSSWGRAYHWTSERVSSGPISSWADHILRSAAYMLVSLQHVIGDFSVPFGVPGVGQHQDHVEPVHANVLIRPHTQ